MSRLARLFIAHLFVLAFVLPAHADNHVITAKVVGVADGDTITVLKGHTQIKIRLHGIDAPEKGQAFGMKAKQFASDLVFGKTVTVRPTDTDRYGRTVAWVFVDGLNLNEELVQAGYAWHYKRYSNDINLAQAELAARKNNLGLWSDPNAIPPWEFRQLQKKSRSPSNGRIVFHGNVNSRVFHQPSCEHYNCKNCTVVFGSRSDAISAGYRPCGRCRP